jgi:hypothetical protein
MNFRKISVIVACFILGGLFTYAGVMKVLDPVSFSSSLAGLGFLPAPAITPLAMGLPAVEIAFGISVLGIPALRRAGALGLAFLLGLFIAILGWTITAGKEMGCSCFGGGSLLEFGGLAGAVVRNLVLLSLASYVLYHEYKISPRFRSLD